MIRPGFNKKLPNLIQNYTNDDAMVVSMKFESGAIGNIMACCAAAAGGGVFLNIWAAKHTAKFTDWAHHVQIHRQGCVLRRSASMPSVTHPLGATDNDDRGAAGLAAQHAGRCRNLNRDQAPRAPDFFLRDEGSNSV